MRPKSGIPKNNPNERIQIRKSGLLIYKNVKCHNFAMYVKQNNAQNYMINSTTHNKEEKKKN